MFNGDLAENNCLLQCDALGYSEYQQAPEQPDASFIGKDEKLCSYR
jgi:hypothetical protein